MLSHQELKRLVRYEPDTGRFYSLYSHKGLPAGREVGSVDDEYIRISVMGKLYKGHRLAWFYMTGSWPSCDIDHINGIKSDNRFCNLREASRGQNMMNIGVKRHNTSGYKGVSFYSKTGKWKAQIQSNGRKIGLGYFDDIKEAAEAYIFAALDLHGEYARIE